MKSISPFLTLTIACSGDISVIEKPDTIINDTGCESLVWYPDLDGDGLWWYRCRLKRLRPAHGYVDNNNDCNDDDASITPMRTNTATDWTTIATVRLMRMWLDSPHGTPMLDGDGWRSQYEPFNPASSRAAQSTMATTVMMTAMRMSTP